MRRPKRSVRLVRAAARASETERGVGVAEIVRGSLRRARAGFGPRRARAECGDASTASRAHTPDERGLEDAAPTAVRPMRRDGAGDARERRADRRRDGGGRGEQRQFPQEMPRTRRRPRRTRRPGAIPSRSESRSTREGQEQPSLSARALARRRRAPPRIRTPRAPRGRLRHVAACDQCVLASSSERKHAAHRRAERRRRGRRPPRLRKSARPRRCGTRRVASRHARKQSSCRVHRLATPTPMHQRALRARRRAGRGGERAPTAFTATASKPSRSRTCTPFRGWPSPARRPRRRRRARRTPPARRRPPRARSRRPPPPPRRGGGGGGPRSLRRDGESRARDESQSSPNEHRDRVLHGEREEPGDRADDQGDDPLLDVRRVPAGASKASRARAEGKTRVSL